MITRVELQERANKAGLAEQVVEKDYVIGWLLWAIGSEPDLSDSWVFKGGTCLKKCYIETYRFSEDLDFTVIPSGSLDANRMKDALDHAVSRATDESGIDFRPGATRMDVGADGSSAEGRVYYVGPRNGPMARVKIDLRSDEHVARPSVLRPITHPYSDSLPSPAQVRCYGFEELFAEKIRAMGERSRPRDLYDIIYLFRLPDFRPHGALVREVLAKKCTSKGIQLVTLETITESPFHDELQREWENMLGHQLPTLPSFQQFWDELPSLFEWLSGAELPILPPLGVGADTDSMWSPPPTFWETGPGAPLEPVRFAAINRLCVDLTYLGSTRLIEPYSLRRTSDGFILLHAIKVDSRQHRSYRLDRIQGVAVTNRPFKPVYALEFTPSGAVLAPQARTRIPTVARSPRTSRASVRTARRRVRTSRYVVQCLACGKRFYRDKSGTRIGKHKAKGGYWACSGRSGFYV